MTNHRKSLHMIERFADGVRERPRAAGAPERCAVCGEGSAGIMCREHWFALPWELRNDAGNADHPAERRYLPKGWLAAAMRALSPSPPKPPQKSWYVGREFSKDERRGQAQTHFTLAIYEDQRPNPDTCQGGQHPCPWVSCRHHLYLNVTEAGTLQLNHPGKEVDELEQTCVHDVVRLGAVSAAKAGAYVGLKRGRVGQMLRSRRLKAKLRKLRG